MADNAIVKILTALLKHQVKRTLGEEALGVIGQELAGIGGDKVDAKIKELLGEKTTADELEKAAGYALDDFRAKVTDDSLRQWMAMLPLGNLPKVVEAIEELPTSPDETKLETALRESVALNWKKLTAEQVDFAVSAFLSSLRKALLPIEKHTLTVIGRAVLRTEDGVKQLLRWFEEYIIAGKFGTAEKTAPERKQKVSLAKLPSTSPDLFGRADRLKELDAAWDNPNINIFSLVAWGGVGKSALVNVWLNRMAKDNYRGAERVYGWSFYSQGAAEGRQVSADQFIAAALTWFGDPDPTAGSPWDKGERLAELVKQSRTLLILDGLEPLQNPPPVETGRIKDPALVSFLREVARQNPGLVVVTTRLAVDDLKDFKDGSAKETDLESLSDESGAAYLKHLGVDGTDAERQQASHDFGGHALALTLLGRYLKVVHNGDVRKRGEIPHVMDEQKQGAHARRVMESYERWLQGKPELDILRLMGLFDRPAEKGALDALRKEPVIPDLTDTLQNLSGANWKFTINNLRELRLLAPEDTHGFDTLDCHPLLREHFSEKIKTSNLTAWRTANNRLYEYYKAFAKELPDTLEEMAPLFAAVLHGCQAGKHQNALNEVYWKRIQREDESFNAKKLGAIGTELVALSGFFDPPWSKLIDGLSDDDTAFILTSVGFHLRALGRLSESVQVIKVGQANNITSQDWKNAARQANNLSEVHLIIGDLVQALNYAYQSVDLAIRSGDWSLQRMFIVTLAVILHQTGRYTEIENLFRQAEELQKKNEPKFPLLYSAMGFHYCDLLLSQGNFQEAQKRANQTLKWMIQHSGLLDVALDNLSLGRAHLLQAQYDPTHPFNESLTYLKRAVDGLRRANNQPHIPLGLLARAEYYRLIGDFNKAQKDLEEAYTIATRGGMGLHLADCHLEYARLYLAHLSLLRAIAPKQFPRESGTVWQSALEMTGKAREHLTTAKEMINKMGYHRRDKEVEELEKELSAG